MRKNAILTLNMEQQIFFEISLILITATAFATVAKFFKQPMIPAYILAGVILGPSVFHVLKSEDLLHTLSTFGIAFLLFLVGIELDIRKFLKTSRIAVVIGLLQMILSTGIGYLILISLGFSSAPAFFLSVALGFSSTIVALKVLGEKKELDTLYGQIVIGILLTQDFIAVLFLILFNVFSGNAGGEHTLVYDIGLTILKGIGLFSVAFLAARYILTHLFTSFARSSELLFLGAICWCLVFSILAHQLGFSIEVGSLLAGVSLSSLPYSVEIGYRIRSLRDFFLPIFFAILGSQLIFSDVASELLPTAILSVLVMLVSPIVVMTLLLAFGYRSRTSFQAGNAIGQVSEFSFIVVSLGYTSGIIERNIVSMIALIGLITMTVSVYMMQYDERLYQLFRPLLKKLERKSARHRMESIPDQLNDHVVLFGHHVMGYKARRILHELKLPMIVVDHNPDVIQSLVKAKIPHLYGSIGDEEILEKVRLEHAAYIISTVPKKTGTLALLQYVKRHNIKAPAIVTAFTTHDALQFYANGAAYVIFPQSISADELEDIVTESITRRRKNHIKELEHLKDIELNP